jgi:hypothetical protein
VSDWKLVPVEPTPDMWRAGMVRRGTADIYRAMLAAAPPPVVDDAMVRRALDVLANKAGGCPALTPDDYCDDTHCGCKNEMRAALTAALDAPPARQSPEAAETQPRPQAPEPATD